MLMGHEPMPGPSWEVLPLRTLRKFCASPAVGFPEDRRVTRPGRTRPYSRNWGRMPPEASAGADTWGSPMVTDGSTFPATSSIPDLASGLGHALLNMAGGSI